MKSILSIIFCVSHSDVSNSATPWTVAHQAPLSMKFSKEEYFSGFLFPSPGGLPVPGINPGLPHCRHILYHLSQQGRKTHKFYEKWERNVLVLCLGNIIQCYIRIIIRIKSILSSTNKIIHSIKAYSWVNLALKMVDFKTRLVN